MRSRTRPSENTNKKRAWGDEASTASPARARKGQKVEGDPGLQWHYSIGIAITIMLGFFL